MFSAVRNCMTNLHCAGEIVMKNDRENPDYEQELLALTGAKTMPILVVDGKAVKGSEEINQFLVGKFL